MQTLSRNFARATRGSFMLLGAFLFGFCIMLTQATAASKAANRAKGDFLVTMCHEIRTPMNGVIGNSDFLLETSLQFDHRDFIESMRSSGEAMLEIVDDTLDYSKIEAGLPGSMLDGNT